MGVEGEEREEVWRDLVSSAPTPSFLMRLADELSCDSRTSTSVTLLHAHAALRQRRFAAAAAAFEQAREERELGRVDSIGYATALRATGRYEAADAVIEVLRCHKDSAELAVWQAVREVERGRLDAAVTRLRALEDGLRSRRTDWFESYLAVAERNAENVRPELQEVLAARYAQVESANDAEVVIALTDYKSPDLEETSCNVGDHIQTIAMARHLARFLGGGWSFSDPGVERILRWLRSTWKPSERAATRGRVHVTCLDRDCLWPARTLFPDRYVWMPLHGWFYHRAFGVGRPFPVPENVGILPVSFHLHAHQELDEVAEQLLRECQPVGCRDWPTAYWLLSRGVDAFFSGCVTASLSVPTRRRSAYGPLFVDAFHDGAKSDRRVIRHDSEKTRISGFSRNLERARRLLDAYAGATTVTTSRLHCYLPCRAFGTPVTFRPRNDTNRRYDGLVDTTQRELDEIRQRITGLLGKVFKAIAEGRTRSEVRDLWRTLVQPLVGEARTRLCSPPRLFGPNRAVAVATPRRAAGLRKTPVPVVIAFDKAYARHAEPLIHSIRKNASKAPVFRFLVRGMSGDDIEKLKRLAGRSAEVFCTDHHLDGVSVRLWGMTSLSTMDRLFLPTLLPDVDRVLYIDADAVVLGDVWELAEIDPSVRGIAARPTPTPQARFQLDLLEYAARSLDATLAKEFRRITAAAVDLCRPSFNAGVLVLSLARLRALEFTPTAVKWIEQFGLQDEQILNVFSRGAFNDVPTEWNAMPYSDWCQGAKLIHWAGPRKPWMARPVRCSDIWRGYGGASERAPRKGRLRYWSDPDNYAHSWEDRARRVAGLLSSGTKVLDLGCGKMALRRYLPRGCEYTPADLYRWTEDVVGVDLEEGEFPEGHYDVVAILGVLEHVSRPAEVLRNARGHTRSLIVSYSHPGDSGSTAIRQSGPRMNGFSEAEAASLFKEAGWTVRERVIHDVTPMEREVIYKLEPREEWSE